MGNDNPSPPELDTSECGPGVDRCMRARTTPEVVIRCERHFLDAISAKPNGRGRSKPPPRRARAARLRLIKGGANGNQPSA